MCALVRWFGALASGGSRPDVSSRDQSHPKAVLSWRTHSQRHSSHGRLLKKSSFMYLTWPRECGWHDILGLASPGRKNCCNFIKVSCNSTLKFSHHIHRGGFGTTVGIPTGKKQKKKKAKSQHQLVNESSCKWIHQTQSGWPLLNCRCMS